LYLCLPPVWGIEGGDLFDPLYSWDSIWIPRGTKPSLKHSKKKGGLHSKEFLQEIFQQRARSSGAPSRSAGATTVEVSPKGRDEPAVRNMPAVRSRTSLLRARRWQF
jgi:hypothetical protein